MATTTPLDIVTQSLRSIGAVADGETAPPSKANFAFDMLNDMLDSLSNDRMFLFCQQEVIHELVANQFVYTIGPGGNVGATFVGSIAGNVLTVTSLSSGALSVGQNISGTVASPGPIKSLDIAPGSGFTTAPTVSFTGDGVGVSATLFLTAQGAVSIFAAGVNYKVGDLLTFPLNGGTANILTTIRVAAIGGGGTVTAVAIENGGQWTVTPTIGLPFPTGGSGTGLRLFVPDFGVGSYILNSGGVGYTTCTATVSGGGGLNALVVAIIGGTSALAGTTITSYGTATGGNGLGALGTYFLNLSQAGGISSSMQSFAPRPQRINSGSFVRVVSSGGPLDYPIDVLNVAQYERLGLKALPGPWPRGVYYQPSEPVGILNYWPNPSQGEMHLMCDMLLNQFNTLSDTIILPPGYKMALRWMLAELLMPHYPATAAAAEVRQMIPGFASQARSMIKRTNMQPMDEAQFDSILNSSRMNDAGWILSGGFGR